MEKDEFLLKFSNDIVEQIYNELTIEKKEPDTFKVIPLLLFKTMLDKIEALQILVNSNQSRVADTSHGIARAVIECQWNLQYMIKEDCDFRTKSYYYFSRKNEAESQVKAIDYKISLTNHYLEKRKGNLETLEENLKHYYECKHSKNLKELAKFITIYGADPEQEIMRRKRRIESAITDLQKTISDLTQFKQKKELILTSLKSDSRFTEVLEEVENLPKGRIKQFPKWYSLKSHISSLMQLANHLGLSDLYTGPYGEFSQETHVQNATKQIVLIEDGTAVLKDLYNPNDNQETKSALDASIYSLSIVVQDFLVHYGKNSEKDTLTKTMGSLVLQD